MAYETVIDFSGLMARPAADKTTEVGTVVVEGHYLGSAGTPDNGYGPGYRHFFQRKDGTGVEAIFGKTRLDKQLGLDARTPSGFVEGGQAINEALKGICLKITFTGMSKPQPGSKKKTNPAYLFLVQKDVNNRIDTANVDLSTVNDESLDDLDETGLTAQTSVEDNYEVLPEEADLDQEEEVVEQPKVARPLPPRTPAQAPSPTQQARVQELLKRNKRTA
jgi:hypothetical protein